MKSYRKTNFRIQQRNQHLINILEENYYIELGTIDIPVMDKLLHGNVIDLKEVIYKDIEEQLKQRLSTKVSVNSKGNGTGRIEIDFYNHDDLERLLDLLNR